MIYKVLVITAQNLNSANEFCNNIGAEGNTFSVPLYNDKNELTNYCCGWLMTDEQFEAISNDIMFMIFDTIDEALTTLNLHRETQGG